MFSLALLAALSLVSADMYIQSGSIIRGSNNRLDDENRDRNNANRLFDSQNNNRGGVNVGSMWAYEGSTAYTDWANQHGCGNPNLKCEIILQYACEERIRDGTTQNTIPTNPNDCTNLNCDTDVEYGRHESFLSYMDCLSYSRNKGLFTANQNMGGNAAIYTRQNPNGNRNGYECPEERDYYPYWRPSIWRDIAIITDDPARCAAYQRESQNVKGKEYCVVSETYKYLMRAQNRRGFIPVDKLDCETLKLPKLEANGQPIREDPCSSTSVVIGGVCYEFGSYATWVQDEPWGIDAPECIQSIYTRDNHLGHVQGGYYAGYNWTIPSLESIGVPGDHFDSCVFRARYNITTTDFDAWENATSIGTGYMIDGEHSTEVMYNGQNVNRERDPANVSIWESFNIPFENVSMCFKHINSNNQNDEGRVACREYVLQNNPKVDIFGSLLDAPQGTVKFQLAVNTAQFGRTFQDRSHTFGIRKMEAEHECAGTVVHNVGVSGKRGNIVQTYPSHEYDYGPEHLDVQQGDCIHFQWTGSNTNPNNNAGQGRQGSDRSNVVPMQAAHFYEGQPDSTQPGVMKTFGQYGTSYPGFISKNLRDSQRLNPLYDAAQSNGNAANFLGWDFEHLSYLAIQKYGGELSELDDAPTYVDAGAKKVSDNVEGTFHYMSTRNNNFSNRSQKGRITVRRTVTQSLVVGEQGGALLIAAKHWLQVPEGSLSSVVQMSVTALPHKKAGDTSLPVKPHSDFLFVNPEEIPLEAGTTLGLVINYENRPLADAFVYHAKSLKGEWTKMDATELAGDMASISISEGGIYVVSDRPNAGKISVIVVFVILAVVAISYGIYRKNKIRGANFQRRTAHKPEATASAVQTTTAAPSDTNSLPEGWSRIQDRVSGRIYYTNNHTGESTYDVPTSPAV